MKVDYIRPGNALHGITVDSRRKSAQRRIRIQQRRRKLTAQELGIPAHGFQSRCQRFLDFLKSLPIKRGPRQYDIHQGRHLVEVAGRHKHLGPDHGSGGSDKRVHFQILERGRLFLPVKPAGAAGLDQLRRDLRHRRIQAFIQHPIGRPMQTDRGYFRFIDLHVVKASAAGRGQALYFSGE